MSHQEKARRMRALRAAGSVDGTFTPAGKDSSGSEKLDPAQHASMEKSWNPVPTK